MASVELVNVEPSVRIEFTVDEFRGLLEQVITRGTMNGAWWKLRKARDLLTEVGVEGLAR